MNQLPLFDLPPLPQKERLPVMPGYPRFNLDNPIFEWRKNNAHSLTLNGDRLQLLAESSRYIFVDDTYTYVFKVTSGKQNKLEYENYQRLSTYDKRYFIPVLGYFECVGFSVLVQPYVDCDDYYYYDSKKAKRIIERLRNKYNIGDIWVEDDGLLCNCANINGRLKIYDYGWACF